MKYIKPMDCDEFSEYLLTLKTGDVVNFGCYPGTDWPNEMPDRYSVSGWYFVKVMEIPEYESRFILIDYLGGTEAFAIPLNSCSDYCDEDDKWIVPKKVEEFFENCDNSGSVTDYVFVEMEE